MFILPKLDYTYDSLEPFIDAKTMEIHHSKHHQTYVDKLNETLKDYPDLLKVEVNSLLKDLSSVPEVIRQKVINFGGGHANHSFFWKVMGPSGNGTMPSEIVPLKDEFTQKSLSLFGSGWTWIIKNDDKLEVATTSNQDSPLMTGSVPVLGIDLWEHSYYLKFQNRRAEYIESWWNIINWNYVKELLK